MILNKTKRILKKVCKEGISWTHNKGYSWYSSRLLPAVESAANDLSIDRELLSDSWYIIGDIHDFNDAPLKAIESYKNAIKFDPNIAAAYREIASMLERIGKFKKALKYINMSLNIDPTEKYAIDEKVSILNDIKFRNTSIYKDGDILWGMNEHLANQKFELDYADWFYMPVEIYEDSRIWTIFKKIRKNIKPSLFIQFDSLTKYYKELSEDESLKVKCDFMIFTSKNDIAEIRMMRKKFPMWKELKKY